MQNIVASSCLQRLARAALRLEGILAPVCALALLAHPTHLTWPALVLGVLPSAARWVTTGRPWHKTPFDLGLVLLSVGAIVGMVVTLDPAGAGIRLAGLAAALILFAWARERPASARSVQIATAGVLAMVAVGAVLLLHIAAPFLRLDRVPPLALLANLLEPLGLYRLLVADEAALQRFRLYASGVGALAAVGLAMCTGFALARPTIRRLMPLGIAGLFFGALLLAADNRGSMVAAALTVGAVIVWWRPRLKLLAGLVVFGTLDLIALGVVQRGFNLRTVVERLDFWQKGLLLASETPFTGVGLGVESVQLVYRASFQPAYPPFSHAHNIYVQGLLEQGLLGLIGLALLTLALLRFGVVPSGDGVTSDVGGDTQTRAASLALFGGALALFAAGLTEIVALTTVGGALLFGLLGLLAAAHDTVPPQAVATPPPTASQPLATLGAWWRAARLRFTTQGQRIGVIAGAVAIVLVALMLAGLLRPLAASPLLNASVTALYRATLPEQVSRAERTRALGWSVAALNMAAAVDPDSATIRRNLSLAVAAAGDRAAARRLADEALAKTDPDDRDGLFGVGRAYAAAGAYDLAIQAWTDVGAGPQLMRLGRQLAAGQEWERGISAFVAAARVGAPPRPAADAIGRAAIAHGESTEAVLARLAPFVDMGGNIGYNATLQIARLHRLDSEFVLAEQRLFDAEALDSDEQLAHERGMLQVWRGQFAEAEPPLRWAVTHPADPPNPVPDGDDARYWLAYVLARTGRHTEAVTTARAGLAALPDEQASLRLPYHLLLGESLLAAGSPDEALTAFQAARRLAPSDQRAVDGIARARAAQR